MTEAKPTQEAIPEAEEPKPQGKLIEYLNLFIEREMGLHMADDQPYSVDWNLIHEAQAAIIEATA